MRQQMEARLETLKKELETGQAELQKVEMRLTYLREMVLRIEGAVQVLEELLAEGPSAGQTEAASSEKQPAAARADRPSA
jgi:hypothetical protein